METKCPDARRLLDDFCDILHLTEEDKTIAERILNVAYSEGYLARLREQYKTN